jgi:hypothetical protein
MIEETIKQVGRWNKVFIFQHKEFRMGRRAKITSIRFIERVR